MIVYYPEHLENIWHRSKTGVKYRLDAIEKRVLLKQRLQAKGIQVESIGHTPTQLLTLAHTQAYVDTLVTGEPREVAESSGLMWLPELAPVFANSCQTVIAAATDAIHSGGSSATVASGGHHATSNRGYGFNPVNEIAVCVKYLLQNRLASKIAILDLDVHYANGTNELLHDNASVLNVDIWNKTLPQWQLTPDTANLKQYYVQTTTQYFAKLEVAGNEIVQYKPDIILYHSGVDVWEGDRLGGIPGFTQTHIHEREHFVFQMAKAHNIPIVLLIGGGYARHDSPEIQNQSLQQIVDLHMLSFAEIDHEQVMI